MIEMTIGSDTSKELGPRKFEGIVLANGRMYPTKTRHEHSAMAMTVTTIGSSNQNLEICQAALESRQRRRIA